MAVFEKATAPLEPAPWVLHVYPPLGLPECLLGASRRMSSAQGYLTLALTPTLTLTLTLTSTPGPDRS